MRELTTGIATYLRWCLLFCELGFSLGFSIFTGFSMKVKKSLFNEEDMKMEIRLESPTVLVYRFC